MLTRAVLAILWLGEPRWRRYWDRRGSGQAEDAQAQLAGNPPQCEPVRRFSRPYDGGNVFPLGR